MWGLGAYPFRAHSNPTPVSQRGTQAEHIRRRQQAKFQGRNAVEGLGLKV